MHVSVYAYSKYNLSLMHNSGNDRTSIVYLGAAKYTPYPDLLFAVCCHCWVIFYNYYCKICFTNCCT